MKLLVWPLGLLLALTSACGTDSDSNKGSGGSGGFGGDASDLCPDPKDPRVHYVSADPNECTGITLDCTREQNGFQNQCGCGCIDKGDPQCPAPTDPGITWVSHDPAQCPEAGSPSCPSGEISFNNTCGCGCIAPGS